MKITDRKFLNVKTPSCHASSVAFHKGKPFFSWFGGSREGAMDCAIYVQFGDKVRTIGHKDRLPRWNPILFPYQDQLFLFVKAGVFCDRWQTFIYNISDPYKIGKGSINPQILPAGLNGPVKTKAVVRNNGLVLCGSSVETIFDWTSYIETYTVNEDGSFQFVDRSNPLAVPKKSYNNRFGTKSISQGVIQPTLWTYDDKMYHAFLRSSRGLNGIYYSYCDMNDGDLKWAQPVPTDFGNPNSSVDVVCVDGRLFLVHNPSTQYRIPLVVTELDKEMNPVDEITIRAEVDEETNSSELSYPYMIEYKGKLHITYTYGRSFIECCEISI